MQKNVQNKINIFGYKMKKLFIDLIVLQKNMHLHKTNFI